MNNATSTLEVMWCLMRYYSVIIKYEFILLWS